MTVMEVKEMEEWELTKGVDVEKWKEAVWEKRADALKKLASDAIKRGAFLYMLEHYVCPLIEDKEMIAEFVSSYSWDYNIQLPVMSRAEMGEWIQLFEGGGFKLHDPDADDNKRANKHLDKGNYLRFNLMPTEETMDDLNKRFSGGLTLAGEKREPISPYAFDVYIDFFPTENADCKITNLGTVKRHYEQTVWEITCPEGAEEMQLLLGGMDDDN